MSQQHDFPQSLKEQIVYQFVSGEELRKNLIEEYDLRPHVFDKWVKEYRDSLEEGLDPETDEELIEESSQEEVKELERNINLSENKEKDGIIKHEQLASDLSDYSLDEVYVDEKIHLRQENKRLKEENENMLEEIESLKEEINRFKRESDILREAILILGRKAYTYPDDI